jgi:hypothetical protein
MNLIGQRYRLSRPTATVLQDSKENTCLVLPGGSVIRVESVAGDGQMLSIRCQQQEFRVFEVDLEERHGFDGRTSSRRMLA